MGHWCDCALTLLRSRRAHRLKQVAQPSVPPTPGLGRGPGRKVEGQGRAKASPSFVCCEQRPRSRLSNLLWDPGDPGPETGSIFMLPTQKCTSRHGVASNLYTARRLC